MCWLFWALPSLVFGELTHLNEKDKHPTVILSADKLGVFFTEWAHRGVRSDKAVQPGSGFFYFEGRREVAVANYGFGIATAAAPLDNFGGADNESLGLNVLGSFFYGGSWAGNLEGVQDTYGFAVDYRGTNPIVHIIISKTLSGPGEYLKSVTLTHITGPIYILVYGNNSEGALQQTINAGDDLGGNPFRYDVVQVLTEAYFYPIDGIDEIVPGWGVPDPGLNQAPVVIPGPAQTVVMGSPVTVTATAQDDENGNLTAAISWSDGASGATGSGGSFQFVPSGLGSRILTAEVTDQAGATASAQVIVTVIASGAVDSDGDGLTYDEEMLLKTDPSNPDSDGEGLNDGLEVSLYGSNPLAVDSDGDGMDDRFEALCGLFPTIDDAQKDPDEDGYVNLEEFQAGTEPLSDSSHPALGRVLLNPGDGHGTVSVSADGLGALFSSSGQHGIRSDVAIVPGSGWYYFEGQRQAAPGNFGFGVATAAAPLDNFGGATGQSFGINAVGQLFFNGVQVGSYGDVSAVDTYGVAVDYSGATPVVHPIVNDIDGGSLVLGPVALTGISSPLFIFVYGESVSAGVQQTINAGHDPENAPFRHGANYHLFQAGQLGAEFLGSGWGPDHTYAALTCLPQFDPVELVLEPTTGAGISLGPNRLGASYSIDLKMAVRANQGMIGQFRYFEAYRSVGPFNIGQGLITAYGDINPYCCVSTELTGAPPSMSVNSSSSIWRNLVSQTTYDTANTHYGFAVDYRAARPIVYTIIGNALVHTMTLDDVFTPLFPMLYGNPQGFERTNTANFGASPFAYDARQILTDAGVNTTELILGWGNANDPETPVITGQNLVSVDEDQSLELALAHLLVTDPTTPFPGTFTLSAQSGTHYSLLGNTLTPMADYHGKLAVPVTVNDGVFASKPFKLIVNVNPINDHPQITGQQPLTTPEDTPLLIQLTDLLVSDVDNDFPGDFSLTVLPGVNYDTDGSTVTPVEHFNGNLSVEVRVNDGSDNSPGFFLALTVEPVNDIPQVLGQDPLATAEETEVSITLDLLSVTDPDNAFPQDFSLVVLDGPNYSKSGNAITPNQDFNGTLHVPIIVNDGSDDSGVYQLEVTVTPVNDPPFISGQVPLTTPEETPLTVQLGFLTVTDPDTLFPDQFSLSLQPGSNYSVVDSDIVPDPGFMGLLNVGVTVHDGADPSPLFFLQVTVCSPPVLQNSPLSQNICLGDSLSMTVLVSGPGPFSYQWRKDGVAIADATASQLNFDTVSAEVGGSYDCVVGNGCDMVVSEAAIITALEPIALVEEPIDQTICPGDGVVFSVQAQGTEPLTYQWRKDGLPITGAQSPQYQIASVAIEDQGFFDCVLSNDCGMETTVSAQLIVDGPLNGAIDPPNAAAGLQPLELSALITCALPQISWQWQNLDSGEVFGENQMVVFIDPLPMATTQYQLTVQDDLSRETFVEIMTLLVSQNPSYLDLNGDGCNSLLDLFQVMDDWLSPAEAFDDPNGDGVIDVRDMLFIDVSQGLETCNP